MKKFCIALLLLVLGISPLMAATCGDVNSDGMVNIVDALMTAQHYVGLDPQPFDPKVGDVNGDGGINIIDALQIAQHYVGLLDQFSGCSTTPTPGPTATPQILKAVFAVNCGGDAYTSSDGTKYLGDTGYSGGSTYSHTNPVSGTSDEPLYQSERYGNSTYSAAVPNGEYLVTLHFAESYHTSTGMRTFDVVMEGKKYISSLDLFAQAGANTAYMSDTRVPVIDGEINIEFVTVVENAKINAIKVTPISYTGEPVAIFSINPSFVEPGKTVTVDATASFDVDGSITAYRVDYGDGYIATSTVSTHQYPNEGEYIITVTVTDNDGKTGSSSKNIFVKVPSSEVRVYPIGDSITEALNTESAWRYWLWKSLVSGGHNNLDFVGSMNGTHGGTASPEAWDMDHDGHWGWTAQQIDGKIGSWAPQYKGQIAIIFLGTNDIRLGRSTSQIMDTFKSIIDELRKTVPTVKILICKLPYWNFGGYGGNEAKVDDFNRTVPSLTSYGPVDVSPISIVDLFTGYNWQSEHRDGIHPNPTGAQKISGRMFPIIDAWLKGN